MRFIITPPSDPAKATQGAAALTERFPCRRAQPPVGILEDVDLVVTAKVGRARDCLLGPAQLEDGTKWIPVAVVGASASLFGAVWGQAELRKILDAIGARVIGEELPVSSAYEAFDIDGSLRDPALRAALADLIEQLLEAAWAGQPARVAIPG